MKSRFWLSCFTVLILTSSPFSSAFARGGDSSGGGSIVFYDGKWSLADMFVGKREPGTYLTLSPEMRQYLQKIGFLVQAYRNIEDSDSFWNNEVLSLDAEYRSVSPDQLPCQDDPLPLGDPSLKQLTYGCTVGTVTYLIPEHLAKLSFKDRALAIVHERIHAQRIWYPKGDPETEHRHIADFIQGLSLLIDLKTEQESGTFRRLFPGERSALRKMSLAGGELGTFREEDKLANPLVNYIHPYGGGAIVDVSEFASTGAFPFQGMDSVGIRIADDETIFIGAGSRIALPLGSTGRFWVEKGTRLEDSELIELEPGRIANSTLKRSVGSQTLHLENSGVENSRINNVTIVGSKVSGSRISNSVIRGVSIAGESIQDCIVVKGKPDRGRNGRACNRKKIAQN